MTNGKDGAGSFVRAIVDEAAAVPGFEEDYEVQRVIDAAVDSDSQRKAIELT